MRTNKLLWIGVMFTLLLVSGNAFANEKDSLVLRPFGLGFDTQLSSNASGSFGNSIFCVFNIDNKFRIEPEISYIKATTESTIENSYYDSYYNSYINNTVNTKVESKTYTIGVGIFRMYQYQKTNIYVGARIAYGKMISEATSETTSDNPNSNSYSSYSASYYGLEPEKTEINMLGLSPTIGAEYFFNPYFSIGGEVGLAFLKATNDDDENNETEVGSTSTYSSLMVRFYFK